jgi:hypothetical protein
VNGLANWDRLTKGLAICFAVTFLVELWWAQINLPPPEFSWKAIQALLSTFGPLSGAAGGAVAITGAVFWLFTKWGWRQPIFRKLGVINFPDLTGTWHATSYPAKWKPFTTVVSVDHSFYGGLQMTLIRNQSSGETVAAHITRTSIKSVRLYVTYYSYSSSGDRRPLTIPVVDHGENHSGTLFLDLNDERLDPKKWALRGEYWTNKRQDASDDRTKGTWGKMEMYFQRREPASDDVKSLRAADKTWLRTQPESLVS